MGARTRGRRRLALGAIAGAVLATLAAATEPRAGDADEEVTMMDDRANLARLVAPLNAETARLIADERTTVERLPTPFLLKGIVFKVVHRGKHKPIGLTVGYALADNFTALLPGDPAAFEKVAQKAGVRLDSPPLRVAYAVTMLETTRRFDTSFGVIRDIQDLRVLPAATPEESARLAALEEKYRGMLKLPNGAGEPPWRLPIHAIVGADLWRFDVTLEANGKFALEKTKLEENVPVRPLP
jgi:hypothetical protein